MTLNELLPTYGYWGGPGWSAGERTPPGKEPNWDYGVYDGLDALFLKHDKAYWDAEKKAVTDPAAASQIIFEADIALMRDIASGNWDSGLYGALYAPLAELAFGAKSLWDLANIIKDKLDQVDNDEQIATPYDDIIILTNDNDVMDALSGNDYVEGKAGNDILIGNNGDDILWGGSGNDNLYGGNDHDILYGDSGSDTLSGGTGADELYGGSGNDVLLGNNGYGSADAESDQMYGGIGYDTYVANNGDLIFDDDGSGLVVFEGELLTGGEKPAGKGCEGDEYKGNGGTYTLVGNLLIFTDKNGKQVSISGFNNGDLGITLDENPADNGACPVEGACPKPVTPPRISLALPTQYIGGGGGTSGPAPKLVCVYSPELNSTGIGGGGSSTGPIVLDLNRNGITSISLAASIALFDYDGDGVLENTAWSESGDALLVNDINNDGIINNATELFGNYTRNSDGSVAKSGYQALSYYDTNSDSIIDATDTRFNELDLWIDSNQDGVTDTGELKTLTEMGVTSLTLNSATPYIPTTEETNTIIQETTFTDASGEGIMRDVLFRYENTSKPTEGIYFDMDANGMKEKMMTWTDPSQWMIVKDINNDGQINNGSEIVGNRMTLSDGTKATDTIQALMKLDINHDGKVDVADNSGLAFWTDRNHNGLTDIGELEALGAAGAIQVIKLNPYQTLLSGYDNNHDGGSNVWFETKIQSKVA